MPQKQSFCQFYTFWVRFTRVSGVKFCKKDVLVSCGKKLSLIEFAENQLICSLLSPNLFICFILYLSCLSPNCLFFALIPMTKSKYILTELSNVDNGSTHRLWATVEMIPLCRCQPLLSWLFLHLALLSPILGFWI